MPWVFDPESADETGLVGVGADLQPETLLSAYASGCFPTRFEPYNDERLPMFWWSPDPRAILELDQLHISRRLMRTIRQNKFVVTFNRDFAGVMHGCGDRVGGTWITSDILQGYQQLHQMGHAHSVEVWLGSRLVGGTYGVALGGLFAAESMFYRESNASKIAIVALVSRLRERDYRLLDIQMLSMHTESLGATEVSRAEYLARMKAAIALRRMFV